MNKYEKPKVIAVDVDETLIECNDCHELKKCSEFHKDRSSNKGIKPYCKPCMANRRKKWNCHGVYYESAKQWGENKWRDKTPEEHERIKSRRNKRQRERLREDSQFKVHMRMSVAMRTLLRKRGIKKGNSSWLDHVDYSKEDLVNHLIESLDNIPGYSWDDFMAGRLHIDHKKPQSLFEFDSPGHPEFKKCWALDNLQLLPADENIKKGAKII